MSNAGVKILDWGQIYQESLATEILRSERRRVTILAALFAFAACFYTLFAFVPALLTPEFRVRFQTQWPRFISLYGAVAAYEWTLRAGIGWLIEHRRRPNLALRFVNAFVETSIPRRAWLPRLPALFLFYSALDTSIGRWMCLFTGLVAAVEHFIFSHLTIGTIQTGAQASFWQTPVFNISRSLILFVAGLVAALVTREIRRQVELSLRTVQDRDRAVRIFGQYVSPQIAEKLLHQPVDSAANCVTSA